MVQRKLIKDSKPFAFSQVFRDNHDAIDWSVKRPKRVRIARCTEPGAWWERHVGATISVFATDSYGHWTRDTGPMRLSQWVKVADTEEVLA